MQQPDLKAGGLAERLERERAMGAVRDTRARRAARQALAAVGLPTSRDENWKYANLRALERLRWAPASARAGATAISLPPRIDGFLRQVFVDGLYRPELSDAAPEAPWLHFARLHEAPEKESANGDIGPSAFPDLRFALLNTAFAPDGASIDVRAGGAEPVRLELVFVATLEGTEASSYPRTHVRVAPTARCELIERHLSEGEVGSFIVSAAQIALGENARLSHFRIQRTSERALWVDTLAATVARNASYELHSMALGAASARSTSLIRLAGEGAHACVYAAAIAERQQVLDGFVRVEHAAPRTTTAEVFRGIAGGRSRVAFNGAVVVEAHARGADSRQSLRGLITGPEAEIDARPQLEIHTDDVRCSHGATAGTLDENMLFYLLSRGIDRAIAQGLLEWAFLEDVMARISVAQLRREVESAVAGRLRSATSLKELL
jgi:Fe-S cluster assembly protein SufD